jgi:predicted DNA-binding transcriptional regulator AlpA
MSTRSPHRQWELEPVEIAPPLLLGPGGAERLTGLRAETLREYAKQPGGPAVVRLSSRRLMFVRTDLLAWIARRTQHSPALLDFTRIVGRGDGTKNRPPGWQTREPS